MSCSGHKIWPKRAGKSVNPQFSPVHPYPVDSGALAVYICNAYKFYRYYKTDPDARPHQRMVRLPAATLLDLPAGGGDFMADRNQLMMRMGNNSQLRQKDVYHLAIVGGGASGTLLLLHLLETIRHPFSVVIFQKGHARTQGVAYSTSDSAHLLNVRAGRMSAYAGDPDHFTDWLRRRPEYPAVLGGDPPKDAFVPRYLYGLYLSETLEKAMEHKPDYFSVTWKDTQAVSVTDGALFSIRTEDGEVIRATDLSICTGIEAPSHLPGLPDVPADARIYVNPWLKEMPDLKEAGDVLIIGTGLTMVDHTLSLLNAGFKGRIIALSKHGHLPMAHPAHKPAVKQDPTLRLPGDLSTLFQVIRKRIQAHPDPQGWEEPILEDLRPYSQQLWFHFSREEKQRFLRHLQHHWSKLRHRIPFAVHQQLELARQDGRLQLLNGRVSTVDTAGEQLLITVTSRKGVTDRVPVQRIFNCVGPVLDISQSTNPLLCNMAQQGLLRNSEARLGPDATMEGHAIGAGGTVNERITLLGPLLRGVIWEAVAIPEIRVGAEKIARHLSARKISAQHVA